VTKRAWPWVVLGVLVVVVLAVALWPEGEPTQAHRAHTIAAGLKCQECTSLSIADSNAPTSKAIRTDIARRVAAGESDDEIRQHYVDQYGEQILLDPQSSGISLLVWVLPVVVLVAGATGVVFAIARNRREPRLHATAADEALVARERDHEQEDRS
jgi:cytochrome c-type biogenesis protein CcmH